MAHLDGRWSFGLKYFTSPPVPLQPSPSVDELCIHPHNFKLIQLILLRFFYQNMYSSEFYKTIILQNTISMLMMDGSDHPILMIIYTHVPNECETTHISTSTIQRRQHWN